MKTLRHIFALIASMLLASAALSSCIEDGFTSSPSDQPAFSTDTVRMGTLFTLDASPTQRFIVYNRHDKGLNISRIAFSDDPGNNFRLNVDGMSGREFNNVEIRRQDSIFVFVETTLPENGRNMAVDLIAHIEFQTNGVSNKLPVKATGRDVTRLKGNTRYTTDTHLTADKPYQVFDSLVVENGASLTIPAGTEMFFHDDARIVVHGSLHVEGTAEKPVSVTGDRFGFVAAAIPYEIMSGQWRGIEFTPTSSGNSISHATIRNSAEGLRLDNVAQGSNSPALRIVNSQVRNTKGYILQAAHSNVEASGCEFTDASLGLVRLVGGTHTFNHCTFANYYLFTALGGPAVQFGHINADNADSDNAELPYLVADFSNSIIYGNGTELSHGDLDNTEIYLRNCMLKSAGSNDEHFINCLWEKDPLYLTDREAYHFDYRLQAGSPAIGAGDPALTNPDTATDRFGTPRSTDAPTLGAYEPKAK